MAQDDGVSSMSESLRTGADDLYLPMPGGVISEELYGRSSEMLKLLKAYQNVVMHKSTQNVVVHGDSGSGKSSLIESLREPVCKSRGFFCFGKHFQNSEFQESYAAIAAAFSDLCDFVDQAQDLTEKQRTKIRTSLSKDGRFLSRIISNLSALVDLDHTADPPVKEGILCTDVAYHKVKAACKNFLFAMTSLDHPVVIVLDDCQWADEASKELIRMILEDKDLQNLLFVCIYRAEEADSVSDLFIHHEDKKISSIIDIEILNLDGNQVNQMLSSLLAVPTSESMRELGKIVLQRTHGNPFFVKQFVDDIKRQGLLTKHDGAWCFDVEEIRTQTTLLDTLATFLSRKISGLPVDVRETLKIASLLGFCFKEKTLTDMMVAITTGKEDLTQATDERDFQSLSAPALKEDLTEVAGHCDERDFQLLIAPALKEGLIERTKEGYQFCHDSLQASFLDLVGTERAILHKSIGEAFLSYDDADYVCQGAVHLNEALEVMSTEEERERLTQLNLKAAKVAIAKSAFSQAQKLLERGLDLIPVSGRWSTHYAISLEASVLKARTDLILGDIEASLKMTNDVLNNAKSVEDNLDPLMLRFDISIADFDLIEGDACLVRALLILEIKTPSQPSSLQVIRKIMVVKRLLRGKTDSDILSLPKSSDRTNNAKVRFLVLKATMAFLTDDENALVYFALLAIELSLKNGTISPYSAVAFGVYGVAEFYLGNHNRANRFGNLAVELAEHLQHHESGAQTIILATSNLTHWRKPVQTIIEPLRNATNTCFTAGDLAFASHGAAALCWARLFTGYNLAALENDLRPIFRRLQENPHFQSCQWFRPGFQFILNLQSNDERTLTNLTGEAMSEGEYERFASDRNSAGSKVILYIFKLQLAFHFGEYDLAEFLLMILRPIIQVFRCDFEYIMWPFYGALTCFERHREEESDGKRSQYLWKARKFLRMFDEKRLRECPNVAPLLPLLKAESLSYGSGHSCYDAPSLIDAYDTAVESLSQANLVHLEALANERAGFALVSQLGDWSKAESYFVRALELYREQWGATAKADWLEEKVFTKIIRRKKEDLFVNSIIEEIVISQVRNE